MNLSNVLVLLKSDLNSAGEELLLAKEPDENDSDIDLFITNRSKSAATHLIKHTSVPLYFTHKDRGFAFYLSNAGIIKAVDLYDAPFISDHTIDWFSSRAKISQFNPEIKVLSEVDQAAHLIYKAIKKNKPKRERYGKIINLIKNIKMDDLCLAVIEICQLQGDNSDCLRQAEDLVELIYSNDRSFERFTQLGQLPSSPLAMSVMAKINRKITNVMSRLEHSYFLIKSRQEKIPMICIVGVDGVGKSSTIRELGASLSKIQYLTTRMETKTHYHILTRVYMSQLQKIFDLLSIFLRKCSAFRLMKIVDDLKLRMHFFVIRFDTRKKICNWQKKSKRGIAIIIDRWWSDLFVAKKTSVLLEKSPCILKKFLSLPQPGLFVIIEVPAKVSIERRPDENLKKLSQKKEALSAFMVQHFEKSLLKINGTNEMKSNVKQIHQRLYETWHASTLRRKELPAGETI